MDGAAPDPEGVNPSARARLAEEWTKIALMEHASIAAFARFTLQLMSLGAPADLVERSQAATSDETLHAKLAFTIASTYAGHPVGPGPLELRGALAESSLREIFVNVIREGCVGETVAAVEAAEAVEHAVDPVVRRALARIAEDELRHAELAWRFVRWAIETRGDELGALAWHELTAVRDSGPLDDGILPVDIRHEARFSAIRIVRVCARAILGPAGILSCKPSAA
jgi:hypothetical protein